MKKIDPTVLKETKYIALWVLIFSALMQAVFLVLRAWDYTALLGNLLGGGVAVLNFLLMGITVQNALQKEEKDAQSAAKVSQLYRNLMLLVVALIGVLLPVFNTWAVLISLFFPRIAIAMRPLFHKD
ncbi:MAG: ATP synthase subunit I [Clostridia bacterium]|nr:ATP synthase subunit I [Clostridia bacterium]